MPQLLRLEVVPELLKLEVVPEVLKLQVVLEVLRLQVVPEVLRLDNFKLCRRPKTGMRGFPPPPKTCLSKLSSLWW